MLCLVLGGWLWQTVLSPSGCNQVLHVYTIFVMQWREVCRHLWELGWGEGGGRGMGQWLHKMVKVTAPHCLLNIFLSESLWKVSFYIVIRWGFFTDTEWEGAFVHNELLNNHRTSLPPNVLLHIVLLSPFLPHRFVWSALMTCFTCVALWWGMSGTWEWRLLGACFCILW